MLSTVHITAVTGSKMESAFATVRDGQVALDGPVQWPDGTRLEVRPLQQPSNGRRTGGDATPGIRAEFAETLNNPTGELLDESWWPLSVEESHLLADHMAAAEPLELTPEELSAWDARLAASKEQQRGLVQNRWDELDQLFQ